MYWKALELLHSKGWGYMCHFFCIKTQSIQGAIVPIFDQPAGVTLTWEKGYGEVRRANHCCIGVPKPF